MKVEETQITQQEDEPEEATIRLNSSPNHTSGTGRKLFRNTTQRSETLDGMKVSNEQTFGDGEDKEPELTKKSINHQSHGELNVTGSRHSKINVDIESRPKQTLAMHLESEIGVSSSLEPISIEVPSSIEAEIEKGLELNKMRRLAEEYDFKQHIEASKNLVNEIDVFSKPENLIINQFTLSHLKPEALGIGLPQQNFEGSSAPQQILRDELRKMNHQQRQQYMRLGMKSQGQNVRKRTRMLQGDSMSTVSRFSSRDQIPSQSSSAEILKPKKQEMKIAESPGAPSFSMFRRSSNATHHFFNQRQKQRNLACFDSFEQLNNSSMRNTSNEWCADITTEDEVSQNRLSHIQNQRGKSISDSQIERQELDPQTSTGFSYPNVLPQHVKLQEKNKRRQSKMFDCRATNKSKTAIMTSASAEKILTQPKKRLTKKTMQRNSMLSSGEKLSEKLVSAGQSKKIGTSCTSLKQFNAAYEVTQTIKQQPIFDSVNKTVVKFPSRAVDEATDTASKRLIGISVSQVLKKNEQPEYRILHQVEKDMLLVREKILQQEMHRSGLARPLNALEQQAQDQEELEASISNLRALCKCLWRFEQAEPVFKKMEETLVALMDRKKRQIMLFEEQVRGQFSLIQERIEDQRKMYMKVENHLRSEIAFRNKVLDREAGEVMRLIQEYEETEFLQIPKDRLPIECQRYSDLQKELRVTLGQMMTGQADMRAIYMSMSKELHVDRNVSKDAHIEVQKRQRTVQIQTAVKVLEHFYDYKEKKDVKCQTAPDQISMLVKHYENSFEAMLHRETELQVQLDKQKKRMGMQKNKIDMYKKKNRELTDTISIRETQLEEQSIKFSVVINQLKNHENELYGVKAGVNELKSNLADSQKLNEKRLAEVQYARTRQRDAENVKDGLLKQIVEAKSQIEELRESGDANTARARENEAENKKLEEDIAKLKEKVSKFEKDIQKKEELHRAEQQRFQKYRKSVQETQKKVFDNQEPIKQRNTTVVKQGSMLTEQITELLETSSHSSIQSSAQSPSKKSIGSPLKNKSIASDKSEHGHKSSIESNSRLTNKYSSKKEDKTATSVKPISAAATPSGKDNPISLEIKIKDGKCPTCKQSTKSDIDEVLKKEVDIVNQFQQMVIGRRSSIFGRVIEDTAKRIRQNSLVKDSKKLTQCESDSEGSSGPTPLAKKRRNTKRSESESRTRRTKDRISQSQKKKQIPIQGFKTNIKQIAQIVVPVNSGIQGSAQPIQRNLTQDLSSQNSNEGELSERTRKKLFKVTEKVSSSVNYRFALDDSRIANHKAKIEEMKKQAAINSGASGDQTRCLPTPQHVSIFEQQPNVDSSPHELGLTEKLNELYGGLKPTMQRQLDDKANQTDFTAEDIQRMFIHKVEDLMGMRPYRAASASGKPRIAASAEEKHAEAVFNEQQSFSLQWRKLVSKVRNVSNVKKMRKFEPLRKTRSRSQPDEDDQ